MLDTTELKGLSESGQAPKSRIQSANATRDMYQRAVSANDKRCERDAYVKGLVDGNRPYDQAQLEKNAQRYRSNFNNGEAESYLNTAVTAFYDLFSEVDTRATVTVPGDFPEAKDFSDIITIEFQKMLDYDYCFDWSIQCSIHDMVLYGRGPQIWEDPVTWRPKRWKHSDVIIPDRSPSNVADWERCFLRVFYRVDELYSFIADEKAATNAGWNVDAVKKAIKSAANQTTKSFRNDSDWSEYQQWIRNNDMAVGDSCPLIECARFLYKEFPDKDGQSKISEAWVWVDGSDDEFLFQEERVYDDFRQVINAFFYDRGDGTAHSVRGLGVKMYHMLHAKMRLQNATVDSAFARASIMFQSRTPGEAGRQQLGIVHLGPYSVIPNGLEPVTAQAAGAFIDAPLAVSRDLDGTLASNLGQYRARLEKPEGNPRTAFEVSAELQKQSILGKTQIARFYAQLDEYYSEIFRRAALPNQRKTNYWQKIALDFQAACAAQGVPVEILNYVQVKATRTVGQGSGYMRALSLGQTFQELYPVLPEDGKVNLVNDIIAARIGRQHVSRYNPAPPERPGEAGQRWDAQVENDTLRNRGQVLIAPYHNDTIHAQEHIAFASQAAQSLQSGANPSDIYGILQSVGAHVALHLQRLSTNPARKAEFKVLEAQFKQLAGVADQLEDMLKQQAQAGQEQAAMAQQASAVASGQDPETQLKWAEAKQKAQINQFKATEQIKLKQQKQAADLALKDARTAADIHSKTAKDAQQIRSTAVKNAQQMNKMAMENEQEMEDMMESKDED